MNELFVVPFFSGLILALLLPLVGNLLRLRDEWLATLGYAHLATATALAGMAVALPPILGAPVGAVAGAAFKHCARARGHSIHAWIILAGWSVALLVAANTALGDALAHAVVDGQLYFAGAREFWSALALTLVALPLLSKLAPRLIAARLFPEREHSNGSSAWRWHLGFDLLAALTIAAATATLGLLGAFALIFAPSWLAFRHAPDWRRANWFAAALGAGIYLAAFALALALDQPFGPLLAALCVVLGALAAIARRPVGADFRT